MFIYKDRLYILNLVELKMIIMDEIHKNPYSRHPGYQNIIATTRKHYYWIEMKKDILEYIAICTEC